MGGGQPAHDFPFSYNCQAIPRFGINLGYRMLKLHKQCDSTDKVIFVPLSINK